MVLKGVISQRLIISKDRTKRILAYEVMRVDDAISNLIREMAIEQIYSVIQTSSAKGMCTMNDCLASLCKKNLIEKDAARKLSPRIKELDRLLERKG
jgi:twitching motility protein PilT